MDRYKPHLAIVLICVMVFASSCGNLIPPTPTPTPTPTPVPCGARIETNHQEVPMYVAGDGTRNVVRGGLILNQGEGVSFGASGERETSNAGFWRGIDNSTYNILFYDAESSPIALIKLQGDVVWDDQSCLVSGIESFLTVQLESGVWLEITNKELIDGRLALTVETGTRFRIVYFDPNFYGVLEMLE